MQGETHSWDPKALRELLACAQCRKIFDDNVALLVSGDNEALTDEQAAAVHVHLQKEHESHVQ